MIIKISFVKNNDKLMKMLSVEIYEHILKFTDGHVRSQCEVVSKTFFNLSTNIKIYTSEPELYREVKLIKFDMDSFFLLLKYKHKDLIMHYIDKSINWNLCILEAYKRRYISTIKFLLWKYDLPRFTNQNSCMIEATRMNSMEGIILMLNEGATNYNSCMIEATTNNYVSIVKLMLNHNPTNHDTCLLYACGLNHTRIVELLLNKISPHDISNVIHGILNINTSEHIVNMVLRKYFPIY